MMYLVSLFLLLTTIGGMDARSAETLNTADGLWPQYGYIGLCAGLLAVAAIVLISKPARKMNE